VFAAVDAAGSDIAIFLVVVGARFLVPLLIPRFPLPAIVAALVIDAADQTIFQQFTDLNLDGYQSYDKALDIYYLTVAYLSVFRNWTNGFAVDVARFLWYYRLVGVMAFEITEERWLLLVFPNTFEYYFIAYELVRTMWDPRRMSHKAVVAVAAGIWVIIKLPQEWWIHIAQNDFTDFMKETVFGVDPLDSWSDAFGNRPLVLVAILAAIAGLVVLGVKYAKRLPVTDWPFGFDVDRPAPVALWAPDAERPDRDGLADTHVSMRWPLFEKVVLLAFVGGIFALVLGVEARGIQIVAAVTLLVLVNAALSALLVRRGVHWSSVALQFVALAALNTVLLAVYSSIISEDRINRGSALFFGLLLTMILVLFDRFRQDRLDRSAAVPAPSPTH
jgi:hypothetical protein